MRLGTRKRPAPSLPDEPSPEALAAVAHNLTLGRYALCGGCGAAFALAPSEPPPWSVVGTMGAGRQVEGACPNCGEAPALDL